MLKYWNKIKDWFNRTGLTFTLFLVGGFLGKVLFDSTILLGAGMGIFVYLAIGKLINK